MKKTFLLAVIAMLAISFSSTAQYVDRTNFKAGLNAGLPVGDAGDVSSFSLGLDIAYHIGASDGESWIFKYSFCVRKRRNFAVTKKRIYYIIVSCQLLKKDVPSGLGINGLYP